MVLVILAVMWVVVLVPPLLRSRQDSRPSDSVVSFRRQLSTLQRTGPHVRTMARPHGGARRGSAIGAAPARVRASTAVYGSPRPTYGGAYRMSRSAVRRRRQNVLSVLTLAALVTLVAAAASGRRPLWYAHVVVDVLLVGYVYLLVQLRKLAEHRGGSMRPAWYSAA